MLLYIIYIQPNSFYFNYNFTFVDSLYILLVAMISIEGFQMRFHLIECVANLQPIRVSGPPGQLIRDRSIAESCIDQHDRGIVAHMPYGPSYGLVDRLHAQIIKYVT